MARDLLPTLRDWLVGQGAEATPRQVRRGLEALGVVAEPAALEQLVARLTAELVGAGVLQPLLQTAGVTDVLVNGPASVWVDSGSGLRPADLTFPDEASVRSLAQRMAAQAGRRLDDASPFVDARLPDGVRLHAALPPLASPGTLISLRVPASRSLDLDALVTAGSVSPAGAWWLRALMAARCGFLVTGATGAGKTTVLRALLEVVPHSERIVAIEESAELEVRHPQFVRLEARVANAEGRGRVALVDLMRQALRMRPDRVVVGEVRGAEVVALMNAMNTGHEGSCGTVHANDAASVPARIEALALAAGLDRPAVHSQLAAGVDAVLHVSRGSDGRRRIAELGVLRPDAGSGLVRVDPLLTFTPERPRLHLPHHPLARRLLRCH
ncbi:MAG: TadA family conjugal transfer-associated ATPase [Candidatus Nanopelagicales bacterium]